MYFLKLILQLVCFLLNYSSLRFLLLAEAKNNSNNNSNSSSNVLYLKHSCSTNKIFPPNNSAYRSNLHTLLSSLYTHATTAEFYNTTAPGPGETTIYGMFMCRGDVTKRTCQNCTGIATREIASRCPNSKEAIIWYHECLVRYSDRYFLSKVDEWPRHKFMNYSVTTNSTKEGSYGWLLANTLSDAVVEAANPTAPVGTKKFATKHASLGLGTNENDDDDDDDDVYTLVQCTPDLTSQDCSRCLRDIMKDIPLCCLGRDCGMVLYPSCSLMFGIDQFYRDVSPTPTSLPYNDEIPPSEEQKARASLKIITPAVLMAVLFIAAVFFANHVRRIKALRRYKAILEENFGDESTSLESLQFDLATLEAATNKFSPENMVGEGGFGKVYKGTLFDGRQVAIKRLSSCSSQGALEFKNEVLSIAKLQHRNLVTLLGFCLQENEKILVYEFVPNKSLDYFLFDSLKERLLNWSERYKIVIGIARAILYLHEYSRLKIIHRDIKPSNILLDNNMNPKISDFGMAKMVALDQDQGRTMRIVGTYGYMSPEYAMLGKFSEKSDVFSFGVMILEIISGKRNYGSYKSYFVDGLLGYAWRQWKDGTPFDILDTNLRDSCSQNEVIKCIQIGLLCVQENPDDRPHMATVVSYLSNISIELPIPREPAFYIDGKVEPNSVGVDLDFGSVRYSSVNEMSISRSFPR